MGTCVERRYVRDVAGAPGAPSVAEELAKLADLRQRGVLTEPEYQRAKSAQLGLSGGVRQRA
jgi:hypothetical protein